MELVLAVFRSRSETINFANILKSYGVVVMIVTTPRQINVSCGISARFRKEFLEKAKEILARRKFATFAGFYQIKYVGARTNYNLV